MTIPTMTRRDWEDRLLREYACTLGRIPAGKTYSFAYIEDFLKKQWIPVTEALPEDCSEVLYHENRLLLGSYQHESFWNSNDQYIEISNDITHWTYLILPDDKNENNINL